jgi:hypothetical protein
MPQVQAESDYAGCNIKLARFSQRDTIESVVARRSMQDGGVVCTLGGLASDSVENVRAFMNNNPSGRELVGGLVRIDGVQHKALGDEGSAPPSLGRLQPDGPEVCTDILRDDRRRQVCTALCPGRGPSRRTQC